VRKNPRDFSPLPFVRLPKSIILGADCSAWWSLPPGARDIYTMLKAAYNGSNNGSIFLYYSQILAKRIKGLQSDKAISSAFKKLEATGWIKRTRIGGLYRFKNAYRLTGKFDRLL
jgi:hypothetical protein